MKDYYKILEISQSASQEVIKASYRALAKKFHPDTKTTSISGKTMAEINEAYEVLSDPQRRKDYDREYTKNHSDNHLGSVSSKPNSYHTTTVSKSKSDIKDIYDQQVSDSYKPESSFFSFVKKVGGAIAEDYKRASLRRSKEIEDAYVRAQGLSDERLIYRFRTSSGAEKMGYARELEYRGYLYKDDDGIYQATYKYKNFRY